MKYPFVAGDDLQVIWKEYQVASMLAHLGQDQSGHCGSMLLTEPTAHTQALLTEDWITPQRISKVPYWFSTNVTCVWLCRSDLLDLYRLPPVMLRDSDHEHELASLLRTMAAGRSVQQ